MRWTMGGQWNNHIFVGLDCPSDGINNLDAEVQQFLKHAKARAQNGHFVSLE